MPELPEVETTRRGILPYVVGSRIERLIVREPRLRWPILADLPQQLVGRRITTLERRGKYLLPRTDAGALIVHLGMSGSLRLCDPATLPERHYHWDMLFDQGLALRFRDPRRFGSLLWTLGDPYKHPLLADLGPEPEGEQFGAEYLRRIAEGRKIAIKALIMDHRVVVGVGNIYANEALFRAGIDPRRAAGRISRSRYERLVESIRAVLGEAITAGGTTLRDFVNERGSAGYFQRRLRVYGREGEPCPTCGAAIRAARIGQRMAFFCTICQH